MHPWFKNFKGDIILDEKNKHKYKTKGIISRVGPKELKISELPLRVWTTDYRSKVLEQLLQNGFISSFKEHHTDTTIDFQIFLSEEHLTVADKDLVGKFKLESSLATSNMVLFGPDHKLKRYEYLLPSFPFCFAFFFFFLFMCLFLFFFSFDPFFFSLFLGSTALEILREYYPVRVAYYGKRKEWLESELKNELCRISNKLRFILAVIADVLKIRNVKKAVIIDQLQKQKFDMLGKEGKRQKSSEEEQEDEEEEEHDDEEQKENKDERKGNGNQKDQKERKNKKKVSYDYLLSMPLWSLTMEKVDALRKLEAEKKKELDVLVATTQQEM